MKMTVTRALAELKLLDARIHKTVKTAVFVSFANNRSEKTASGMTKSELDKEAKSKYDSITALINRRNLIKSRVIESNAKSTIEVSGEKMTVAEAIDRKHSRAYEIALLDVMRQQHTHVQQHIQKHNVDLESKVASMLEANLSSDSVSSDADYENIAKPFIAENELKAVDPIGLAEKIERLDERLDKFETDIDFVLSEHNAKTEIEVPE